MKSARLLLTLPLFVACNNNDHKISSSNGDLGFDTSAQVYTVTSENHSINAAIEKAKKTIGDFEHAFNSKDSSFTDFAVKKRYETPDKNGEHMWIAVTEIINGNYRGMVNNDAEQTNEVKYGDTVIVRKNEITDWMYLDNNVLKGGYTIRELLNQMDKKEQEKMKKEMGFIIED